MVMRKAVVSLEGINQNKLDHNIDNHCDIAPIAQWSSATSEGILRNTYVLEDWLHNCPFLGIREAFPTVS
jgi:hypothetical protein